MTHNYYLSCNVHRNSVIKSTWVRPIEHIVYKDRNYVKEVLTEEFCEKLTTIDDIGGIIIFNRWRDYIPSIAHVDFENNSDRTLDLVRTNAGLNIVFDDSTDIKGTMRWYSLKNSACEKSVEFTEANTPYLSYSIDQLNLEAEYCITDFVTLVRTNVPHSVSAGNQPRTCISIRFCSNMDWEAAVDKFNKAFNKNI